VNVPAVNVIAAHELRVAADKADADPSLPRCQWLTDALRRTADVLVDPEMYRTRDEPELQDFPPQHINGDRSDDRIENLAVLDIADHTRLHVAELLDARWPHRVTAEWSSHSPACVECDTTKRPHGGNGYCRRCYARNYMRQRRLDVNRP
jgi:hypothetical protein